MILMKLFLIIAFGPLLLVIAILMSIYLPQIKMGADKMKDSLQWMTLPITMAAYIVSVGVIGLVIYQIRAAIKANQFQAEVRRTIDEGGVRTQPLLRATATTADTE